MLGTTFRHHPECSLTRDHADLSLQSGRFLTSLTHLVRDRIKLCKATRIQESKTQALGMVIHIRPSVVSFRVRPTIRRSVQEAPRR
jgi:hypothetical protein